MARVNLEEIGRLAGVSRSTVSRVVNGSPNVSPEAKQRVEEVIAETGYQPHAAARSLASNRTGVIGLVIPSTAEAIFEDPYFGRLILGITEATNGLGTTLALFLFEQGPGADPRPPQFVNSGLVDGVIVTATQIGDPIIAQLSASGLPFVVAGRPDEGLAVHSVDADNRGGARSVAHHLAALGRTRPALIAAPSSSTAGLDRRWGFLEGLDEVGLSVDDRIEEGNWSEESGRLAMDRLLATKPDSVFVGSDRMAIGALRSLSQAGLRVPEDIAVVSFDGILSDQTIPRLTSVVQPVSAVGRRAVQLLAEIVAGTVSEVHQEIFPTSLVIRETCGASATNQPNQPTNRSNSEQQEERP